MSFDHRVIRNKNTWYHSDCFKQIHDEAKHVTEFDKIDESSFVKFKTYKDILKSGKKITLIKADMLSEQTYETIHSIKKSSLQAVNTTPTESASNISESPRPKLNNKKCSFCKDEILIDEKLINVKDDAYHSVCFTLLASVLNA